ncbi:MAG TPA: T9SS type A sorting domain-containing protein [Bacteroidia bacterium]|jgi:hypothetical protein
MKKYLLLFSAILLVSIANSQTDAAVMLEPNIAAGVASSSSDQSFLATLPSGENLVASMLYDGTTSYINIKKIQLNGSVTTVKNILTSEPLLGLTCSPTGSFSCFFGQGMDFNLMKFSSSGSVVWQKSVSIGEAISPYYGSAHTINETPAGEYYLTLSNYAFTGLIKIDANGNCMWSKKMTGPRDTGKCPGFCSAVTLSGGCITTLKDENYETIINLDPNGNLVWSRSFGDALYRWTKAIKADNLGNFFIMGTYGNVGSTYVQKMDASGNLVYGQNISGGVCYQDAYVNASNEFFIISQSPSMQLSKIGATGNILWSRGVGGVSNGSTSMYPVYFSSTPKLANISFLTFVNDSSEVFLKFSGNPTELCNSYNYSIPNTTNDEQIFDATIDSTAKINLWPVTITNTTFATSGTEFYAYSDFCSYIASVKDINVSVDLNVYPNPASEFLTIDLSNVKNTDNTMLSMYDMTGKKIMEKQLDRSSMEKISIAKLAAGLYTVIITNSNTVLGKQRVIIQH